mmetsp:Transcript_114739/g.319587  ORF Transcript_114739/g.319587 Transcript_114739/m.319587 type:complete len:121 (+) Transcript_114739:1-363(+)
MSVRKCLSLLEAILSCTQSHADYIPNGLLKTSPAREIEGLRRNEPLLLGRGAPDIADSVRALAVLPLEDLEIEGLAVPARLAVATAQVSPTCAVMLAKRSLMYVESRGCRLVWYVAQPSM